MDDTNNDSLERIKASELYYKAARPSFEALRDYAREFLNLQIGLVAPGFVNHSIPDSPYQVVNGSLCKKDE